jgi:hypothetical protein
MRDPALSLKQARRLSQPLSLFPTEPGRLEGCVRRFDPVTRRLTLLLLTEPRLVSLTLSEPALATLGGAPGIAALARNRVVSVFVKNKLVERVSLAPIMPLSTPEMGQPLPRLSGSSLSQAPALTRCATAELAQFSKLSSTRWIRTGSMALGPLRMHGIKLKQAAILGFTGTPTSLFSQELVQEALRYSGFTRFGGAVGKGRVILILADG